jgi:radical SAM-linked protein
MRLFQRAFKRAGLKLTHTQGFNPRPSVSIALPLSVGVESYCELLDFDLEESVDSALLPQLLNDKLVAGVQVLKAYDHGAKIRDLAYLQCKVALQYDAGIPLGAHEAIKNLFASEQVIVANQTGSKNKNVNELKFSYLSGALENSCPKNMSCPTVLESQGVREHVCEILEGGEDAFKKRESKYGFSY